MPARLFALALLFCLLPAADLNAQTTPPAAGVPSAASAAKASGDAKATGAAADELASEGMVVERRAVVLRVSKDGSDVLTETMTVHVLSDAGLRQTGVLSLGYASQSDTPSFDYVRVRKPSGAVVETSADEAQEVPAQVTQVAPMYSDIRVKQLPVKSLSVGDTLEYQTTLREKNVDAPGQFWRAIGLYQGVPVKEETVELRVPREMGLQIKCKTVQPVKREEADETVYRWTHETASEYPKKKEKDAAPVPLVQAMYEPDIAVTTFQSWAAMGAWYAGLMKGRAVPDAAIQAKADELTKGLTSDDAKIDALYGYVSTQYRYIGVSLGIGRLQPHPAADVFRNQYGDCKDKHTLLQAMLAAEKIDAAPVLVSSTQRVNEALPMPTQFDHMITLVKPGPQQIWLDATPEVAPARVLLMNLRDKLALLVPQEGEARLVRTAAALPFPAFDRVHATGQLDTQGVLTAKFDQTLRGDDEVLMRIVFHTIPRAQWDQLEQQLSYRMGFAGDVTAVEASVPEKTADPFQVHWQYTQKDLGEWPARRIPAGITTAMMTAIPEDTRPPERAIALVQGATEEATSSLTLPAGYTTIAPEAVKKTTPFAEYTATYTLKGQTLECDRVLMLKTSEVPVSEWKAYREFVKAVTDDYGQMVQLTGAGVKMPAQARKDDPEAARLMAEALEPVRAGDLATADSLLQQVKQRNPEERGLWAMEGYLARRRNQIPLAIEDYKKELQLHPEESFTYEALIEAYREQGDWQQAETAAREWTKADPANQMPRLQLASMLMGSEKYKEAVAAYQGAIAQSTKPGTLQGELGRAQLKAGETEAGRATLHALMDHSDDAAALNAGAYELADADLDLPADEAASRKAIEMLESASAKVTLADASNENMATTASMDANWDTLGWIYFKEGEPAKAESYLKAAWMLEPAAEVGLHLGRTYEAEGKKAEALETYDLAAKTMNSPKLVPSAIRLKDEMSARASALRAQGVLPKETVTTPKGWDPLQAMRTYTLPNPVKTRYASADVLLLLGDDRAEDVRFLHGDDALQGSVGALKGLEYRAPLPAGSHGRVLRRGVVSCTEAAATCELVLVPLSSARVEN